MKKLLIVITILISNSILFSQENLTYENKNIKCIYQKEDGLLNGKYQSYYKNKQKKAEGLAK